MKRDPYENAKQGITKMLDGVDLQWLKALAAKKRGAAAPAEAPPEEDSSDVLAALDGA